ncbi:ScbA/BarX family gamma-butyrolactone biosynthesis protein [Streptomyces sp. NPDC050448]|uniref:ScbA/BarX family gamma-butyrolactone biosynthesis protein n=1 Tax=Streptomyces sp. NPDC050448 TaxID=3155404 RepID=UPI00344A1A91
MSASTFHVERTPFNGDATGRDGWTSTNRPGVLHPTTWTTTVPKELVHRAAVAEVMLTGWERLDDTHFTVTAQWPRSHGFYTPVHGSHHDPLIAVETFRQVGALLGHAEFGVPFGHQFLLRNLSIAVEPQQLEMDWAPASVDIAVTCTDVRRRGNQLASLRYEAVIRRDGRLAATAAASYTCISPTVYRRLRGDRALSGERRQLPLTAPAAPQSVGRLSPMDVVLSPTDRPDRWYLRADTRHPVLFDHPVDHIPGMVLLEAARQATSAVLGRCSFLPLSLDSTFERYTELDVPCVIETHELPKGVVPEGREAIRVTGHQNGRRVFSSVVTAGSCDL